MPNDTDQTPHIAAGSRYPWVLAVLFAIVWIALAIAPHYRQDWVLENALVVPIVVTLVLTWRRFAFSNLSYTLIFVFLVLHEIGSHYTYAEVPYDAWFQSLTGTSLDALLGWQRNHFDRVVHFSFGLLVSRPVLELIRPADGLRSYASLLFPLCLLISLSTLFELIEWGAAGLFGGDLGMAYLGTQGDIWDAHRDMALASLGAVIGIGLDAFLRPSAASPQRGQTGLPVDR